MTAIRLVIGDIPRILREIIESTVRRQEDMELFSSGDARLASAVADCGADVVIVADGPAAAKRSHRQLLVEYPELKVFVVTDDGRAAHLLELCCTPVVEVSPSGLVDAIRSAVAAGRRMRRNSRNGSMSGGGQA